MLRGDFTISAIVCSASFGKSFRIHIGIFARPDPNSANPVRIATSPARTAAPAIELPFARATANATFAALPPTPTASMPVTVMRTLSTILPRPLPTSPFENSFQEISANPISAHASPALSQWPHSPVFGSRPISAPKPSSVATGCASSVHTPSHSSPTPWTTPDTTSIGKLMMWPSTGNSFFSHFDASSSAQPTLSTTTNFMPWPIPSNVPWRTLLTKEGVSTPESPAILFLAAFISRLLFTFRTLAFNASLPMSLPSLLIICSCDARPCCSSRALLPRIPSCCWSTGMLSCKTTIVWASERSCASRSI